MLVVLFQSRAASFLVVSFFLSFILRFAEAIEEEEERERRERNARTQSHGKTSVFFLLYLHIIVVRYIPKYVVFSALRAGYKCGLHPAIPSRLTFPSDFKYALK